MAHALVSETGSASRIAYLYRLRIARVRPCVRTSLHAPASPGSPTRQPPSLRPPPPLDWFLVLSYPSYPLAAPQT